MEEIMFGQSGEFRTAEASENLNEEPKVLEKSEMTETKGISKKSDISGIINEINRYLDAERNCRIDIKNKADQMSEHRNKMDMLVLDVLKQLKFDLNQEQQNAARDNWMEQLMQKLDQIDTGLTGRMEQLGEKLDKRMNEIQDDQQNRWERENQELKNELGKKRETIIALNYKLHEKEQTITALNQELKEKEQTITAMEQTLGEKKETVTMLEGQLNEKEKSITTLKEECKKNKEELEKKEEHYGEMRGMVSTLDDQIRKMKAQENQNMGTESDKAFKLFRRYQEWKGETKGQFSRLDDKEFIKFVDSCNKEERIQYIFDRLKNMNWDTDQQGAEIMDGIIDFCIQRQGQMGMRLHRQDAKLNETFNSAVHQKKAGARSSGIVRRILMQGVMDSDEKIWKDCKAFVEIDE